MANLLIIKDILKNRNITIRDFSADLNMSEQGFQKLMRTNSTKIETLELIAKKLDVSIVTFFDTEVKSSELNLNEASPENNGSFFLTIKNLSDTINRQSKKIEELENELKENKKTTLVNKDDAKDAAAS